MARPRTEWDRIERVIPHAQNAILYGPPGTGKTTMAFKGRDDDDIVYVELHEEKTVAEIVGHFIPVGGGRFVFFEGPVLAAWRYGKRLVLDEVDLASGPIASVLRAILNDPSVARLTIPNPTMAGLTDEELVKVIESGEGQVTLKPAEGFQVIATMNSDLDVLDAPLRERFDAKFYVGEPHPNAIAKLPKALQPVCKRTAVEENEDRYISVRSWLKFDTLARKVGYEDAAWAVFAERGGDILTGLQMADRIDLDAIYNKQAEESAQEQEAQEAMPDLLDEAARQREERLAKRTRQELRGIAQSLGLPQGPTKDHLVRRLANAGVDV